MNKQWKDLDQSTQDKIKQAFVSNALAEDWVNDIPDISFRQLFAYANNTDNTVNLDIARALRSDSSTQVRFQQVLDALSASTFITAAAAASDSDSPAEGVTGSDSEHRWKYRFFASSHPPHDYYLIIEVGSHSTAPIRFYAYSATLGGVDLVLEPDHRGVIQMLIDKDHPLVSIMADQNRKIRMW